MCAREARPLQSNYSKVGITLDAKGGKILVLEFPASLEF